MKSKKEKLLEEIAKYLGKSEDEIAEVATMGSATEEAEGLEVFIQTPRRFTFKQCKECNRDFAITRGLIAYCSNDCRRIAFGKAGIKFDPLAINSEERWKGEPPF